VTTSDLRCPECGSLVRGGISWCTLCHADLRSDEEKEAARLEADKNSGVASSSAAAALVLDEALDPVGAMAAPARGRHARPGAVAEPVALAVAGRLAAAPAAAKPAAVEPTTETSPATSGETIEKLAELKDAGIDVDEMLHMLATSSSGGFVDGLIARLSTKGSRAVAVVVGMACLTSLGLLLMFTLGSIFG
jgi:hypothetical protein